MSVVLLLVGTAIALFALAYAYAWIEAWWTGRDARRRRALEVDPATKQYLRKAQEEIG